MFPLRLFLGLTFVYAGLDKVLFDSTFLDSASPTSLLSQLQGFAHTSPLAPLITAIGEPLVGPIGLAMAIAEIAVGLGALTGLLPRASAWGGFAIAILLWLTASFAIHPYYLGPDLPYAAGWLTLALVGDGDVYNARASVGRWLVGLGLGAPGADPERRRLIEGALLGGIAIITGGFGWLLGEPGRSSLTAELQAGPTPTPTPLGSGPAATPKGAIGTMASLRQQSAIAFNVPSQASSFAGDPGVVVLLSDGTAVAYDAVCTHAGCTVGFDPSSRRPVLPLPQRDLRPAQPWRRAVGTDEHPAARAADPRRRPDGRHHPGRLTLRATSSGSSAPRSPGRRSASRPGPGRRTGVSRTGRH